MNHDQVLVLRHTASQGNFAFRLAVLSEVEARRWEERLAQQGTAPASPELGETFGNPLTLEQIMSKLTARDYKVLDVPSPT